MKHISEIIEDILIEWAYRVHDGMPNPKNAHHIQELRESMEELNLPNKVIYEVIQNLINEQDDVDDDDKIIKWKDKDKKDRETKLSTIKQYKSDKDFSQNKDKQLAVKAANLDDKTKKDKKDDSSGKLQPDDFDTEKAVTGKSSKDKKDKKNIKTGIPGQKDKSLKNVNTSESEVYSDSDTGVSDEEFESKQIKSPYENEEDKLDESELDDYFKSGKMPKKYQRVITRLMNSQMGKQSITDYIAGVGAGKLQAQAGEILTMASVGMSDDEFNGFIDKLYEQVDKYPKGSKPVITKDWLDSVKNVRTVTKKRYDSEFGEGNWSISNTAWDVPDEFQALGNDNYKDNKGFSSDMYVKLEVNGKPILDEISLKKDSTANIYNGVVTDINNWTDNVPPEADINEYKKGEIQRPTDYAQNTNTLNYEDKDLLNEKVLKNKNLKNTLAALGVISGDAKKGYKIEPKAQKILQKLSSMATPPPIDRDRFKQTMGTGSADRFKKFMIMHAAVQRANEIANGNDGDSQSSDFLNKHLGYEKGEDGNYPAGSIKRYQNDTIKFLVEDEKAKEGCLNALAEKLPMKSLIDGEEKMAIGGLSADPKTLKRIFGIDNYEDFKAGLTMKEDEEGNNYLVYESKEPAKNVRIAEVKCRQKGLGYASSVGLEFSIAKDFGKELYKANKEEYPPEPEISDKEKRKLGV